MQGRDSYLKTQGWTGARCQGVKQARGWRHPFRTYQAPKTEDGRQGGRENLQAHTRGSCIEPERPMGLTISPKDVTQVYYLMTPSD